MSDDVKNTMPRWAVGRINSAHPAGGDRIVGYRVPEKNAPSPMHYMSMLEDLEHKAARAETAERQRDEALAREERLREALQHGVSNCAKCYGFGEYTQRLAGTKARCPVCRPMRAALNATAPCAGRDGGAGATSQAASDVLQERARQVSEEGWSPEHDDQWTDGEIARAAMAYAEASRSNDPVMGGVYWPWVSSTWKPKDRRRNLVRAGALILAEIERLDRAGRNGGENE